MNKKRILRIVENLSKEKALDFIDKMKDEKKKRELIRWYNEKFNVKIMGKINPDSYIGPIRDNRK